MYIIQDDYQYVESGQAQLAYDPSSIDEETLSKAFDYFEDTGLFNNQVGKIVLIEQGNGLYTAVKFPVIKGAHTDSNIVRGFRKIGSELKDAAFKDKLLEIHLTDTNFETLKVIR